MTLLKKMQLKTHKYFGKLLKHCYPEVSVRDNKTVYPVYCRYSCIF